jgi:hypothetical protein
MEEVNLSPSSGSTPESVTPDPGIGELHKDYRPLFERFGAKEGVPSTEKALKELWDYAKETAELKDRDSVMWEVTKLMNRMGSASIGDKPWSKALVYVQTHRQMMEAEKRLKELEVHL